jgi:hypothetical protein
VLPPNRTRLLAQPERTPVVVVAVEVEVEVEGWRWKW